MSGLDKVVVSSGVSLREALEAITRSGKQVVLVLDVDGRLAGLATDGDVRKAMLRGVSLEAKVDEVMNRRPAVAETGLARAEAVTLMRSRGIRQLPLVRPTGEVADILFLDDLLAPPPPLPNRAVIMAGGEGRRMRPLTETTPKPLLSVGGRSLLEILIERLRLSGLVDIVVALHHRSDLIRERVGDGARLGVRVEYVEEPRPLGTMGALPLIRAGLTRPFFVVNADILTKCDFRAMWDFHRGEAGVAMTVGVTRHQVDIPYGELTLDGSRVVRIDEKPRKEYPVSAGIYVLEPSAIDLVPPDEYFDATDLVEALLARGRAVAAHRIREYWLDVGRLHDLEKANRDLAEGLLD
ncbi:MAG TPA: nucleotidyltransferase family protein [Methylomirabilota bacterium]|nr:nucleotidyltransferase family protein [Methylomirabilota bacterium]